MQLRSTCHAVAVLSPCSCHADALRLPCSCHAVCHDVPSSCLLRMFCWASRHQRDGDEIDEFFWSRVKTPEIQVSLGVSLGEVAGRRGTSEAAAPITSSSWRPPARRPSSPRGRSGPPTSCPTPGPATSCAEPWGTAPAALRAPRPIDPPCKSWLDG